MDERKVQVVKYIGHNVSKVRWKPQPAGSIESSDTFVTGSSEEQVNMVCMWNFKDRQGAEDARTIIEPELVCKRAVGAGVTDICFLDERSLVASLENGGVIMLQCSNFDKPLKQLQYWKALHSLPSGQIMPCTALAVCGGEGGTGVNIVTGGEDGRITVLRTNDLQPLTVIENADNSTVTALSCSLQLEVLSTSSSGQLKIWDLRTNTERPVDTMEISSTTRVSMDSLDRHPHQPHLVAIGREDGSLCFMDLRQQKRTLKVAQAHSSHVWEVKFDRSHPNNLFTCSQDGGVWHWDANAATSRLPDSTSTRQQHTDASRHASKAPPAWDEAATPSLTSPWLSGAVEHGGVFIQDYSLSQGLSTNSMDIESRHLVCATDNEALLVVPNLELR